MRFAGEQQAGNPERPISASGARTDDEPRDVLNAETIEFIAKPAKSAELRLAISDRVLPLLRVHPGFINTILLTSQSEPRRLVAITFWKTSDDAQHGMWDDIPLVGEMLAHLVDSCSPVRAFHVTGAGSHFDEETEVLVLRPS